MRKGQVDHVAILVEDIQWYFDFFKNTVGFTEKKRKEENGILKQIWLDGGIQLIQEDHFQKGLAHIGITVDDLSKVLTAMTFYSLKEIENKQNWLELPNGVILELIQR